MIESLDTKQGAWVKPGRKSGRAEFPGSYGDMIYVRAPPSDYPKTVQQKCIAAIGRALVGKKFDSGADVHNEVRRLAKEFHETEGHPCSLINITV